MGNKKYGFGFKPIEEFTFDECIDKIEQYRSDGEEPDNELLERYSTLLSDLRQRDDAMFGMATDKVALQNYISAYPLDETATKYRLMHISDAERQIVKIDNDRKRKKKIVAAIILSSIVVIAIVVCWINYFPVKYLDVEDSIAISKYGDSISVSVQTNVPSYLIEMDMESGSDWLRVSGENGSYILVAKPNPKGSRNAAIKISAPDRLFGMDISWNSKTISISQESGIPTYIAPTRDYVSFDKFGKPIEKSDIIISTDGVLESVASAPDWCDVSFSSIDKGKYECIVTTGKNDAGQKHGQITLNGGDITQNISVQQESGLASYIGFGDSYISVSPREETKYVEIRTDGTSWTIESKPGWIEASDYGDNSLKLVIAENEDEARKGTITVKSNNGHISSLAINQGTSKASYIRAGQTSISAGTSGLDKYISVSTDGKDWSVSSHPHWVDITPSGDRIYVEVNSNPGKMRDGEIVLASNNGHRATITVKQDGEPTNFGSSQSTVYFTKDEGYESVTIRNNSKMNVTASSDQNWINCNVSGNRVQISCPSNKRSGRRSGVITLRCGSQTQKITVKQNGYIPCWNQSCVGGRVYGPYGWVGPCMICGGTGGQESKW